MSSLSLLSDLSIYNPALPLTMRIPGTAADFCKDNGDILLIVGEIGKRSRKRMEIVFPRKNSADESFHMSIDLERDVIQRWAVFSNITEGVFGEPFEGTVIDREEPFMLRYYELYHNLHYDLSQYFTIVLKSELNVILTAGP